MVSKSKEEYIYKITLGGVFAVFLVIRSVILFFEDGHYGWNVIIAPIIFLTGVFLFAYDFFFQRLLKKYLLLNIIELIILIVLGIMFWDFLKIIF